VRVRVTRELTHRDAEIPFTTSILVNAARRFWEKNPDPGVSHNRIAPVT
jgi:hypothetical protein